MNTNRSMPPSVVIPELPYPDVHKAVEWLVLAFGFVERLRIADHRAQLVFGEGSIIVTRQNGTSCASSVLVRVADVDNHYEQAKQFGANIISPPADYPYGERQYTVDDLGCHRWTFSQTIADAYPSIWGGTLIEDNN